MLFRHANVSDNTLALFWKNKEHDEDEDDDLMTGLENAKRYLGVCAFYDWCCEPFLLFKNFAYIAIYFILVPCRKTCMVKLIVSIGVMSMFFSLIFSQLVKLTSFIYISN